MVITPPQIRGPSSQHNIQSSSDSTLLCIYITHPKRSTSDNLLCDCSYLNTRGHASPAVGHWQYVHITWSYVNQQHDLLQCGRSAQLEPVLWKKRQPYCHYSSTYFLQQFDLYSRMLKNSPCLIRKRETKRGDSSDTPKIPRSSARGFSFCSFSRNFSSHAEALVLARLS